MTDVEVHKWFENRGLFNAELTKTCYAGPSWPAQHKDTLLCLHRTVVNGSYAADGGEWREVWMEVIAVEQGSLTSLLSLPIGIEPLAGPICDMLDELFAYLRPRDVYSLMPESKSIQLEPQIGPDNQTLILHNTKRPLCGERLPCVKGQDPASCDALNAFWDQICKGTGVYTLKGIALIRKEDGVVLDGPSAVLRLVGGTLQGPCVDPQSVVSDESPIREIQKSDLDLDGDGVFDLLYFTGAARWQSNYALYVSRGGCGYHVGDIVSSEWPRRLPTQSHGLYDLLTADDECPCFPKKSKGLFEVMTFDEACVKSWYGGDGDSYDASFAGGSYCDIIWRFNGKRYVRAVSSPASRRPDGIRP